MAHLQPNVVFVFADQMRYQATGFGGDPNVRTPHLDRLAESSLNFGAAISGFPVCNPARASLITGQYPDRHGVFVNDVCLNDNPVSLAAAFRAGGYDTAYVGKLHIDGHGRSNYIPPERRHGLEFWQALECTHDYNHSLYYSGDDRVPRIWSGYDAAAQTRVVRQYIESRASKEPFLLVLSWGPPHNPHETAPERFQALYHPDEITLRSNVPLESEAQARTELAGYYAHISALDESVGDLIASLDQAGIADDTIFVFWSDHGDMLHSQGQKRKQRPWEESIRVPLLIHYPRSFGLQGRLIESPINTPDLMPTLLGLCELPMPATVRGSNYAPYLKDEAVAPSDAALLACYHPFGEYARDQGGREYRGIRTREHTHVRDLTGPWLLYDNVADPYQQTNLANTSKGGELQSDLDKRLDQLLTLYGDEFLPGDAYIDRWGYVTDERGTVPYKL